MASLTSAMMPARLSTLQRIACTCISKPATQSFASKRTASASSSSSLDRSSLNSWQASRPASTSSSSEQPFRIQQRDPRRTSAQLRRPGYGSSDRTARPSFSPATRTETQPGPSPLYMTVTGKDTADAKRSLSSPEALAQRGQSPAKKSGKLLSNNPTAVVDKAYEDLGKLALSDSARPACDPTSARSLFVESSTDLARQYRRLMSGVVMMNNYRSELRLQERYEKPKYKRQRLASARHRRRFAHEIGLRVRAVMQAKRQGM